VTPEHLEGALQRCWKKCHWS